MKSLCLLLTVKAVYHKENLLQDSCRHFSQGNKQPCFSSCAVGQKPCFYSFVQGFMLGNNLSLFPSRNCLEKKKKIMFSDISHLNMSACWLPRRLPGRGKESVCKYANYSVLVNLKLIFFPSWKFLAKAVFVFLMALCGVKKKKSCCPSSLPPHGW